MIDCDVHVHPLTVEALFPYLPRHWVEHVKQSQFKGPTDRYYSKDVAAGATREEITAHSDCERLILNCCYAIDGLHNPDAAIAFASAVNDWLIAEWLEQDDRLRASLVIPIQLPEAAAIEIARVGRHPGFVQVFLPVRTQHPLGNRLYHPLWRAIVEHDLVAGIHYGGAPGNPPFPSGWPSSWLEDHAGMAQVFQSQVCSIVAEGVFDQFPAARVALIEGGFTWLPAFMWRFDKEWKNLRRLVPWVRAAPSEYLKQHMKLTIQPLDSPTNLPHLLETINQIGSDDMLMYASDFPHRHTSDPAVTLLPELAPDQAGRIRSENARAFYRL
ncbi:MAG: amidohydrolase family protein [Chloroflexota bacterium]